MTTEKNLGAEVEAAEPDHAADIKAARLSQIDARIAAAKDEVKSLTEQRKAYLPKKD